MSYTEIELKDSKGKRFTLTAKGKQTSYFQSRDNGKIIIIPENKINWDKRLIKAEVDEKLGL